MIKVDNELIAAYAEDKASEEEREAVRQYLVDHPEEMESVMMLINGDIIGENHGLLTFNHEPSLVAHDDGEYLDNLKAMLDDIDAEPSVLPMMAMVAQNNVDNQCVIRCEGIALRHFGIKVTDEELHKLSEQEGYMKPEGIALHNICRLSEARGLNVSHRYNCNIEDIQEALSADDVVIAAVDANELLGDYSKEQQKDREVGLTPNHVVIVNSITVGELACPELSRRESKVTITDSATPQKQDTYPLSQFLDAWNDSSCYLTIISNNEEYIPHPINLDDVEVEDELLELREAIAENAHEVWAESRRNEGWTYGPIRDDAKKQNPDMLPYNRLPESEKEYDRIMAMNTIKLVKKLGWELIKKK